LFGKACIFKASTWIWLSKVNGPVLPKERWINLLLKKMDLRKKKLTVEAHPLHVQDTQYFLEKCSQ
jgi:hypothetical protein